jgi:hypothetical protein
VESRFLRATRVNITGSVLPGEPFEHTGADRPGHVEVAGIRAVRASATSWCRPDRKVGAPPARGCASCGP